MKRVDVKKLTDPEHRRWAQKYPRFPGVAECVRLIRARKARGSWADIIAQELALNAHLNLPEMIELFRTDKHHGVRQYMMMALEMAQLPESVPFFVEILQERKPEFLPYAERALRAINTPEARSALWKATQGSFDSTS